MRVTKELKSKIERVFEDKAKALGTKFSALIAEETEQMTQKIIGNLMDLKLAKFPLFSILQSAAEQQRGWNNKSNDPAEVLEIAQFLCRNLPCSALVAENKAATKALAREEESFLISIAYAENMGELKSIFSSAGIEW